MKKGGVLVLLALLVVGNVYFWSQVMTVDRARVTGMATNEDTLSDEQGQTSVLLPALLILVIAANILYLMAGKVKGRKKKPKKGPGNLKDVLRLLKKTDTKTFSEHVNSDVNDFADMIKIIDPELAVKIYDLTDKEQMIMAIEHHLNKDIPKKTPEELKDEIMQLKHELDTFDFGGFEKDL